MTKLTQEVLVEMKDEIDSLKRQRALLVEALKRCKAAAEDTNRLPSSRLELVRDYATPMIVAAGLDGGAA